MATTTAPQSSASEAALEQANQILADLKAALPREVSVDERRQQQYQEFEKLVAETAQMSEAEMTRYVQEYLARHQERMDSVQEQNNIEEEVARIKAEAGLTT